MTNVLNLPTPALAVTVDEAFFEGFPNPALLLACYERVREALEVIVQGEKIELEDETHVLLIETCWALSVLFRRQTGNDAATVSADHFEQAREYLLAGKEVPDQHIPIVSAPMSPLPPMAFERLTNQQLACAAFNYSDRVREAISTHSPKALAMSEARITSIDATTALRQLVLRLSGGSLEAMADQISRKPGETLQ